MIMDNAQLLAILALDAYNQGVNPNILNRGADIGVAKRLNLDLPSGSTEAGFSAVAYKLEAAVGDLAAGTIIISYRGTNDSIDPLTGWPIAVGVGAPSSPTVPGSQADLAFRFYESVTGHSVFDGPQSNVVLTGHSLGGGLAGLVASLSGTKATIFDNIPYAGAAMAIALAYDAIQAGKSILSFFADMGTGSVRLPSSSNITSYHVDSEIAGALRAVAPAAVAAVYAAYPPLAAFLAAGTATLQVAENYQPALDPHASLAELGTVQRHAQALLSILQFGEKLTVGDNPPDWTAVAAKFLPSLFDEDIGSSAGAPPKGEGGSNSAADKMQAMIAYSALEDGVRPFGDTAVKAMFDDAGDLGRVVSAAESSSTLSAAARALGDSFVQYAGQLAVGKVLAAAEPDVVEGILSLSEDGKILEADFTDATWLVGRGTAGVPEIVGRRELTDEVLNQQDFASTSLGVNTVRPGMKLLWNDTDSRIIDKVAFATTDQSLTTTLERRTNDEALGRITLFAAGGGNDVITGSADDEFIYGGAGDDTLDGGGGSNLLVGGSGNDRVIFRSGLVYADGSSGNDTAEIRISGGFNGTMQRLASDDNRAQVFDFKESTAPQAELWTVGIETVKLSSSSDTLAVLGIPKSDLGFFGVDNRLTVDGGDQASVGPGDTLDLSRSSSKGVYFKYNYLGSNDIDWETTGTKFVGFESLRLTSGDDIVIGAKGFKSIDGGGGNDIIRNTKTAAVIDTGAGDDTIDHIATGSIVTTGSGADKVALSDNILVTDASVTDRLYAFGTALTGGASWKGSEDSWAYELGKTIKYGFNKLGELIVSDLLGNTTFVAGGQSTNFGGSYADNAFGISVLQVDWVSKRFRDLTTPWDVSASFATMFGYYSKALTGVSHWKGIDPLVVDVDGDGIDLTGQSSISPKFDLDRDGFAERTGWVTGGDGFLALDRNGNGVIDDVSELFGGPKAGGGTDLNGDGVVSYDETVETGFQALAALDGNGDGVVDSADAGFADLRVWIDANEDAITDAGELKTLAELGIESISLASEAATTDIAGNSVTATSTVHRSDGTTTTIADVTLKIDNFDSEWLGQQPLTPEAEAVSELRGHGTLADLRQVVMADETGTLADALAAAQPALAAGRDIRALREAALPVLYAWAEALPITDTETRVLPTVNVVLGRDDGGRRVTDYAYSVVDAQGDVHWAFSGSANPETSPYATFAELQADHPELAGQWGVITAAELAFTQRYLGEQLPANLAAGEAKPAVVAGLDAALQFIDLLAVRLAVQADPAFYGLTYDRDTDMFRAATDRELIPFFEHVFGELQGADAATISARLADAGGVFDRIVSSFERQSGNGVNSYGYIYANIVAAYENVGLGVSLKTAAIDFGIPEDRIVEDAGAVVTGTDHDDIFYLGSGDQTVSGGLGHDNYVVGKNFGHDTIVDIEAAGALHADDYVRFAQVASTDVTAERVGLDLVLTVGSTGDTLTIKDQFDGYLPGTFGMADTTDERGVDLIQFADGVAWTEEDIAWKVSRRSDASETVLGTPDKDVLDGGAGDDTLIGGNDFDIYVFGRGYGHDIVAERVSTEGSAAFAVAGLDQDAIEFAEGIGEDDLVFTRVADGDDLTIGILGTSDTVTIEDQFGSLQTSVFGQLWLDRIEVLQFVDGGQLDWNDIMDLTIAGSETSGDDTVYGFDRADLLDGGAGDDLLVGGDGDDTYGFGFGYGHDVIQDRTTNILSGQDDTVVFEIGITPDDVILSRDGASNDLTITLADGSSLTMRGQFAVLYTGVFGDQALDRIERFVFTAEDGTETTLSHADLALRLLADEKTDGDDTIYGFGTNDRLDGGAGDDLLAGGNGADTYVFGRGWGHDRIVENSTNLLAEDGDVVEMAAGVAASDVVVSRGEGNDIVLTIADSGDSLTLVDDVAYGVLNWRPTEVETVRFADGTTWNDEDLRLAALATASTAGDDTIRGYFSDDTIDGGAGDDLMMGGDGSDTYLFGRGSGHDTIEESVGLVVYSSTDSVVFGPGVSVADLLITRPGNADDLVLTIADTGDSLTLAGQDDQTLGRHVESFVFADGTILDEGDLKSLWLAQAQTPGDDEIVGFKGDDVFHYARGDGDDTIVERLGQGSDDRLVFDGIASTDVSLRGEGNDVIIVIAESAAGAGDGGSVRLKDSFDDFYGRGVESVVFSDGVTWDRSTLRSKLVTAAGTSGNDTIVGSSSADVIVGGRGDDELQGRTGDDTYLWSRGDGNDRIVEDVGQGTADKLRFTDVASTEVVYSRIGNDMIVTVPESGAGVGDGGSVRLWNSLGEYLNQGVEQIIFADGVVVTRNDVRLRLLAEASTSGNDTITGYNTADTITGGRGDDVLQGAGGDDTYIWSRGDGNDRIVEDVGNGTADTLNLTDVVSTAVTVARSGNDVILTIAESAPGAADGGTIRLVNSLDEFYAQGIDRITFADGVVTTRADLRVRLLAEASTAGNDTITGYNTADTITGGRGDDVLEGRAGDDTYIWSRGDGNDRIVEDIGNGTTDTLSLTDVVSAAVTVSRVGNDVILTIAESAPGAADGASIRLVNSLDEFYAQGVDRIAFADGVVTTRADLRVRLLAEAATAGDDSIVGYNTADTLAGGRGNDVLQGAAGDDTYVFAVGDGADRIVEVAGADILRIQGYTAGDLTFYRVGDSLVIGAADADQIAVVQHFDGNGGYRVEKIVFDDGSELSSSDITARLVSDPLPITLGTHVGSHAADVLSGTPGADQFIGLTGDDTLVGGQGRDTYIWAKGDGNDVIDDHNVWNAVEDDTLVLTDVARSDLRLLRDGNQLYVDIVSTGERLTIKDHFALASTGIDVIRFADGTTLSRTEIAAQVWTAGTDGPDVLSGTSGADILWGRKGDDTILGGQGRDTYVWAKGDGNDVIDDHNVWNAIEDDTLVLTDVAGSDIRLLRDGNQLYVDIISTGERLTIKDHFALASTGIDVIRFADGTTLSRTEIDAQAMIGGTPGADTIAGGSGADILWGGTGADKLLGGTGSDTYVYARGDGDDTIIEDTWGGPSDRLVLADIGSDAVTLSRDGSDIVVEIEASGPTAGDGGSIRLSNSFDGTDERGVESIVFADGVVWDGAAMRAHAESPNVAPVLATVLADRSGPEDTAIAFTLPAGAFTDVDGDVLTLAATLADGSALPSWLGFDAATRSFAGTPPANWNGALGLKVTATDPDGASASGAFVLTIDPVNDAPVTAADVGRAGENETKVFDLLSNDGDVDVGDTLTLAAVSVQSVSGIAGLTTTAARQAFVIRDNRLVFEPGTLFDALDEGATATVGLLYEVADSSGVRSTATFTLTVDGAFDVPANARFGTNGSDILFGTSGNDYIDGLYGNDQIFAGAGTDTIYGRGGNDALYADSGDDLLDGGAGDDTLFGGSGNNTLLGGEGNDVVYGNGGNDRIYGDAGDDRLYGASGNDLIDGGDGADQLYGNGGDDQLNGGAGADQIYGGWGSDLVRAGAGDDVVYGNGGNDRIYGDAGDDRLYGAYGNDVVDGGDGNDLIYGNGGSDQLSGGAGNDRIYGDWDVDVIEDGAGDDVVYANGGNDRIVAGSGNDLLWGGSGTDVYVFKGDFGKDVIGDFQPTWTGHDVIELRTDQFANFAAVLAASSQVGSDTVITLNAATSVTLKNVALSSLASDDFRFVGV
jgi:Ca2+-binding RTX toxin-like protein